MAHKVLSSDMATLISSMRLAQQYSTTLLDGEYRKGMLKAAHVLAMDSKNLLDAVDSARRQHMQSSSTASITTAAESTHSSNSSSPTFGQAANTNGNANPPAAPSTTHITNTDTITNANTAEC